MIPSLMDEQDIAELAEVINWTANSMYDDIVDHIKADISVNKSSFWFTSRVLKEFKRAIDKAIKEHIAKQEAENAGGAKDFNILFNG